MSNPGPTKTRCVGGTSGGGRTSISMFETGLTPRLTEGLDVVLTAGLDAALDAAALGVALRLAILTAATLAIASVVSTD